MGETADQTRAEIVQLRAEMTERVAGLRRAARRPIRVARAVAVGTVAVIVVGGVALVAWRISRPRREAPPRRVAPREAAGGEPARVVPLHERILETAARTAATAAVGAALKGLQEQRQPAAAGGRR